MKDDGFLLFDSLIALQILLMIVTLILPTIIYLKVLDSNSDEKLENLRRIYIEIHNYSDKEEFLKNSVYETRGDSICEKNEDFCIKLR